MIAAFVVINVFITIVLNSMQEAREVERPRPIEPGKVAPRRADPDPARRARRA
jgi:hypothetical protein